MNISLKSVFLLPKTAIVDVYNTCNGDTDIMRHAKNNMKKTYKNDTGFSEDIINIYETWIKKTDAWKKFQNELKDKRSSKKKRSLLHFFLVFFLVGA